MTIDSDIKSTQVKFWEEFLLKAESLVEGQTNWVSNLSNISALLYHELRTPEYPELAKDVNWAGFYLLNEENPKDLILGPFQGKIACVQIPYGKGVCGTGYKDGVSQLVHDVHQFPGHIACDSESESELVVPIFIDDKKKIGVIDIDCKTVNGFNEIDQEYVEKLSKLITDKCNFSQYKSLAIE